MSWACPRVSARSQRDRARSRLWRCLGRRGGIRMRGLGITRDIDQRAGGRGGPEGLAGGFFLDYEVLAVDRVQMGAVDGVVERQRLAVADLNGDAGADDALVGVVPEAGLRAVERETDRRV